jgi:hypothetical protein
MASDASACLESIFSLVGIIKPLCTDAPMLNHLGSKLQPTGKPHLYVAACIAVSTAWTLSPLRSWDALLSGHARCEDRVGSRPPGVLGCYCALSLAMAVQAGHFMSRLKVSQVLLQCFVAC